LTGDRLRLFRSLTYRDPCPILVKLRELEIAVALSDLPPKVKALRTRELKRDNELRDACLFCYGMGQQLGVTVGFADHETPSHDFVAMWAINDTPHFATVELKNVVPQTLNPSATVQAVIDSLQKYRSPDLTVAIRFSQDGRFDPAQLLIPKLEIGSLWVFAAITPNQSKWALWGDLLTTSEGRSFDYPSGP
jgi:hypothetical protein